MGRLFRGRRGRPSTPAGDDRESRETKSITVAFSLSNRLRVALGSPGGRLRSRRVAADRISRRLCACWNEFLYALSFIQTPDKYTVTRAMFGFSGISGSTFEVPWAQMMAATVAVTVPLIVLVLIFQNRIIAGLTGGSVKG
ncbi:MAG: carbohydrate ABC transporter permease [Armatimonadetes bacterium]|nr:carbohydrate ABC transporter permease [Armatimonadota bacterium]